MSPAPAGCILAVLVLGCACSLQSSTGTAGKTPAAAMVVPILMYHHVNDLPPGADAEAKRWTVSIAALAQQLDWLKAHGYYTISLAQLADHLQTGIKPHGRAIVLTFDDGWISGYGTVFPMLRERGLSGTFFVYPGGINACPPGGYMSWGQLREMASAGMAIESHTLSHPRLSCLKPEDARREIAESKLTIERELGRRVVAFAYPFGDCNNAVIQMVKDAGYHCAVGVEPGVTQRAEELFQLQRVMVSYEDDVPTFVERIGAGSSWVGKLRVGRYGP